MNQDSWNLVDQYFTDKLVESDEALTQSLRASDAGGLPAHAVAPNQGKLLHLLVLISGARRILEIGTLGAYSTIWMARALPPGGKVVTLESNPVHEKVARANIERAGLAACIEVRSGMAVRSLEALVAEGAEPFDLVFIDADKAGNPSYLEWSLKLTRPGSLIIGDNVVRGGAVADASSTDASVVGVRRFIDMLAAEPRLSSTALQTVGSKGWDGFTLSVVR